MIKKSISMFGNYISKRKRIIIVTGLVFFAASGLFAYYAKGRYIIGLNVTRSLPAHFYIIDTHKKITQAKENYNVVAFYFRHKHDRYYSYNHRFIKTIACEPGQRLTTKNDIFKCDGKIIAIARKYDEKHRPLPQFSFNGIIPKGKYFMKGTAWDSYDSRYWGFINKSQVIGVSLYGYSS